MTDTAAALSPLDTGGVMGVMSRIAAIQSQLAARVTVSAAGPVLVTPTEPTSSTTSASTAPSVDVGDSASSFAAALNEAQGTTQNPIGTVNGVTYSSRSANVTGADVVADAESYLGVPYVYAGNTRAGLDCSGLVQETYKDLGMSLPRISWQQQNVGTAVPSLAQAQPGDILYFGNPAYHVAIYLGNNKMIEAPEPGEFVKIAAVSPQPDGIRRIVGAASAGDTASGTAVGHTAATGQSASVASAWPSGLAAYASLFQSDESRYGLPSGLLGAVAHVESGGNPNAVSPAGAEGLMQLMPGTANSLGVDPLNPTQAVDGAARMLSGLLKKYDGSLTLALAAYNAGPGAVDQYGGVPPYAETQAYVVKVQQAMGSAT